MQAWRVDVAVDHCGGVRLSGMACAVEYRKRARDAGTEHPKVVWQLGVDCSRFGCMALLTDSGAVKPR